MQYTVHESSEVLSTQIGAGTRIWQFCVILEGAQIGEGCNICANTLIENDVIIGNNVTIKSGVQLWDGVRVGSNVFIGPNATFTNDRHPRSKQRPTKFLETIIDDNVSIGANATILPGIRIASGAMIGAGAVVTRDVPHNAVITGNPGTITGYVGTREEHEVISNNPDTPMSEVVQIGVGGCTIHTLPHVRDLRGSLSVAEYGSNIPFIPKRCFWVYGVPSRKIRGEHAHKNLEQYLICIKGNITVVLDDGVTRKEVCLDKPNIGLYIPALVWGIQYKYSSDAILLVLASEAYDNEDYVRNYEEFLNYTARGNQ